jgi:hypothetical protein
MDMELRHITSIDERRFASISGLSGMIGNPIHGSDFPGSEICCFELGECFSELPFFSGAFAAHKG